LGRTLLASAVVFCAPAAVTSAPLALALLMLVGVLDAIGWVMFETALQRPTAPRLLGRAFGLTDSTVRTAMIGSIALAMAGLVALGGASRGRSARRSLRRRRPEPFRSAS
jgi:hypothetical protein